MYHNVIQYTVYPQRCPGVCFLPDSVDPALKQDQLLHGTGVYKPLVYTTAKFIDDVIDSMAGEGSDSYEKTSMIRGHHHMYKFVRTPFIGEELEVKAEDSNENDEHAVAVMKDGCVVGHVLVVCTKSSSSQSCLFSIVIMNNVR